MNLYVKPYIYVPKQGACISDGTRTVATVIGTSYPIGSACEDDYALARKMAAAPQLLASLEWAAGMAEEAIAVRESGDDPDDTPAIIAMHREGLAEARAAIAKATGAGQ